MEGNMVMVGRKGNAPAPEKCVHTVNIMDNGDSALRGVEAFGDRGG
jgi:hypothetical protein